MSISDQFWDELALFLAELGYTGAVTHNLDFRRESLRFFELLQKKNEEVNLTAWRDLETAFWKHLADSLVLLSLEPLGIIADWGSGGGFPGVPMALARKYSSDPSPVVFLDSVGKKIRAVGGFCADLDLSATSALVGRGEDLLRAGSLQGVRSAVLRAVAPPERAVQWLNPIIPNWVFFLGPSQREAWEGEMALVKKKGFELSLDKQFSLPRGHGDRHLLRLTARST